MAGYDEFFGELEKSRIRYLVVGGVAVVLHGFLRATADLDLMVDFNPANLKALVSMLKAAGYRPKPPAILDSLFGRSANAF